MAFDSSEDSGESPSECSTVPRQPNLCRVDAPKNNDVLSKDAVPYHLWSWQYGHHKDKCAKSKKSKTQPILINYSAMIRK